MWKMFIFNYFYNVKWKEKCDYIIILLPFMQKLFTHNQSNSKLMSLDTTANT